MSLNGLNKVLKHELGLYLACGTGIYTKMGFLKAYINFAKTPLLLVFFGVAKIAEKRWKSTKSNITQNCLIGIFCNFGELIFIILEGMLDYYNAIYVLF